MLEVPEFGFEAFPLYPAVLAAANTAIVASAANVTTIFLIGTIPLTRAPRQTAPGLPGFRYRFWIRGFCRAEWIERPR